MSWHQDCDGEEIEYDWRTLRQSVHTARKPHTCDNCQGVIQVGEKYEVIAALDEGRFIIRRDHLGGCPVFAEEMRREYERWEREQFHSLPIGPDEVPF